MTKVIEALVKPELLKWARESAGFAVAQAAERAHIEHQRLEGWEKGHARPTVGQLRVLANLYRRPLAVFFLPRPPKDFDPMELHDFRRLPDKELRRASPALRYAIRQAHTRRDVALDLHEELGLTIPQFDLEASLSDGAEELGARIREYLGITYEKQIQWRDEYDAFNHWRSALETAGVLIFQSIGVSLDEMRGFSIGDRPLHVVVLNIDDPPTGRIFTMLHETAHLALRKAGLCDLNERRRKLDLDQRTEVYCNHVAGAALVPAHNLLREPLVTAATTGARAWEDRDIEWLARRYAVGRETVLRRLLILGRTTKAFYERKHREYIEQQKQRREREARKRAERESGGPLPHRVAIATLGPLFTRLALNAYHQEKITGSDLSDYLEVRLKHLHDVEQEVQRVAR